MAKSAPQVSFSVDSVDYGTIDVGGSSAWQSYDIYNPGSTRADSSYARAINMSISFKESYNASEARKESWVIVSTPVEQDAIGSIPDAEASAGSLVPGHQGGAGPSIHIRTYVSIPVGAASAGHVGFYLHHRLNAVLRRLSESISIQVRIRGFLNSIGGFLSSAITCFTPLPVVP